MNEHYAQREKPSSFIAWLALIIASIALVLGVIAYFQVAGVEETLTDYDFETRELDEFSARQATLVDAHARLLTLQGQIASGDDYVDVIIEVRDIRDELADQYRGARQEALETWRVFETEFQTLENQLRAESAAALDTYRDLVIALENEIESEMQ